jgi:hypothetical protein
MTSTVITDEMVELARHAMLGGGLEAISKLKLSINEQREMARTALSAAAPMILEAAAKVPSEAASICLADAAKASEAGRDSCADRDRQAAHILRGIAADIRALKGGK